MPNPKRKWSKTRTAKRRTHYKATAPTIASCSNCGSPVLYHRVCPECGYYRGKQVMEVAEAK
ncbi:MAG: 50S ribosomal protein L32 [Bacteroidales bacterium]|jgi:large subunit ribosomal protein L32|nr:50S ribosomal protein L32 [Bacteroidales bacterium]MDD3663975.1 50S ribosomal protein L32 [Bacteroidales bacterium]